MTQITFKPSPTNTGPLQFGGVPIHRNGVALRAGDLAVGDIVVINWNLRPGQPADFVASYPDPHRSRGWRRHIRRVKAAKRGRK